VWKVLAWDYLLKRRPLRIAKKLQKFPSILAQELSPKIKYSRSIRNPRRENPAKNKLTPHKGVLFSVPML
jgi:hypothetical protein